MSVLRARRAYACGRTTMRAVLLAALLASLSGCSTYADDLLRAQRLYDDARYEAALESPAAASIATR